ncbi:MAG: hypothetical protein JST86_07505 [Bacteroidetes bacterium]|nr:hypothetical protein [Bacteroidota bacterium]
MTIVNSLWSLHLLCASYILIGISVHEVACTTIEFIVFPAMPILVPLHTY